jgi:hypothetical protein
MRLVNLTPHVVHIVSAGGAITAVPPSGAVARCTESVEHVGSLDANINIKRVGYGAVTGLPDCDAEVMYIVSALVRAAEPARKDLASPGGLVRDDEGAIIGCRYLVVS